MFKKMILMYKIYDNELDGQYIFHGWNYIYSH